MKIVGRLQDIFLEDNYKSITVSFSCIFVFSLIIVFCLLTFEIVFVDGKTSQLLRTLALVQLTTLAIIFSLTVAGIQYATSRLPARVSNVYFKTPIFRLTLFGLAGGAILEISTDSLLLLLDPVFGTTFRIIWLSTVFSIGIFSLLLLVLYIYTFPKLLSIRGLLDYYKKLESTEDSLNTAITVFRGSIRESDVYKGKQVSSIITSIIIKIIQEGSNAPFGATSNHHSLMEYQLPQIVIKVIDNDESTFHQFIQEFYSVSIGYSILCDSQNSLTVYHNGLTRILAYFEGEENDHEFEWMGYLNSFNNGVHGIESDVDSGQTTIGILESVPEYHRDLFSRTELVHSSADVFSTCVSHLFDTYLNIYRIITFNFERHLPPVMEVPQGISIRQGDPSPMGNLQLSLAKSIQTVYHRTLEFDPDEDIVNTIAPPLHKICAVVYTQWGPDSARPMLALYFEAAYLFSELNQIQGHYWDTYYESFLTTLDDNLDSKNPINIVGWYEERNFSLQYLTFDQPSEYQPQQEFDEWLHQFLTDERTSE